MYLKRIFNLRPWYHDFSKLGIQTVFPAEKTWIPKKIRYKLFSEKVRGTERHVIQQPRKESTISPYIDKTLELLKKDGIDNPRILYLFCSDGYYGYLTLKKNPNASFLGIDRNTKDLSRAKEIHTILGGEANFLEDDVVSFIDNYEGQGFDAIFCFGGLYHLENPKHLLEQIKRKKLCKYLIVQTAITTKHNKPEYFETPHPGWTWGSWFTDAKIEQWMKDIHFSIIAHTSDVRPGDNPNQTGSSYFIVSNE